jgi:catalase
MADRLHQLIEKLALHISGRISERSAHDNGWGAFGERVGNDCSKSS